MPVYKYKTFEEAEKGLYNFNPDKEYFENAKILWQTALKLRKIEINPGVYKFKTIEEANEHRYQEELAAAKKLIKMRQKKKPQ